MCFHGEKRFETKKEPYHIDRLLFIGTLYIHCAKLHRFWEVEKWFYLLNAVIMYLYMTKIHINISSNVNVSLII